MHMQAYDPVQFELGGETRTLRLSLLAIRKIKAGGGGELFKPGGTQDPDKMLDYLGLLIWAMLGDESLTVEQVEDMIDYRDLQRVTAAISEVFNADTGAEPSGDGDEGKAIAVELSAT
jgi:hypothetical protein